jgi:hypothetical protein
MQNKLATLKRNSATEVRMWKASKQYAMQEVFLVWEVGTESSLTEMQLARWVYFDWDWGGGLYYRVV